MSDKVTLNHSTPLFSKVKVRKTRKPPFKGACQTNKLLKGQTRTIKSFSFSLSLFFFSVCKKFLGFLLFLKIHKAGFSVLWQNEKRARVFLRILHRENKNSKLLTVSALFSVYFFKITILKKNCFFSFYVWYFFHPPAISTYFNL